MSVGVHQVNFVHIVFTFWSWINYLCVSDYTCRSCPASPTRTPINITIVTPDQLFATPATSAAASTAGVVPAANEDSTTTMTTSTTNEQPSVQSVAAANVTNANNNNIVTIATSSSIAEAMTMVQSKGVSHVLDMSGVRAIQSAPGSPLAGQYRWYPMNRHRFELASFALFVQCYTHMCVFDLLLEQLL